MLLTAQLKTSNQKQTKSHKVEKVKSLNNLQNGIKTLAKSGGKKSKSSSKVSCVPPAAHVARKGPLRLSNDRLSPRRLETTINNSSVDSLRERNPQLHVVEIDKYPHRHEAALRPESELI